MKYRIKFIGSGKNEEERTVDANTVQTVDGMTVLIQGYDTNAHVVVMVPNDRLLFVEKVN